MMFPKPGEDTINFIKTSTIRPLKELLKQRHQLSFLIEIMKNEKAPPEGYNEGVLMERFYALNWLTGIDVHWADDLWKL